MNPDKPLNHRQLLFCSEFIKDGNATAAAMRAGYSPKTSFSIAAELFQDPRIMTEIRRLQAELQADCRIDAERIMRELAKIAFCDLNKIVEWRGNRVTIRDSDTIDPDSKAAISMISESRQGGNSSLTVKMHDKLKALELMGRHVGMFNDKLKLEGELKVGGVLRMPPVQTEEEWENANNEG